MTVQNTDLFTRRMKREEKKRKKALTALLGVMMVASLSGSLYGYWAENINEPDAAIATGNNVSGIGTATTIKGDLTGSAEFVVTENLVPAGRVASSSGAGNIESIDKTVTTNWTDSTNVVDRNDNVKGTLKVKAQVNFVEGADQVNDSLLQRLVKVEITNSVASGVDMQNTGSDIVLNGDPVTSNIKVTLTEPENKDEYMKIKGKQFKVTLTQTIEGVQN